MAALRTLPGTCRPLLRLSNCAKLQRANSSSFSSLSTGKKVALCGVGAIVVGGVGLFSTLHYSVRALELELHPPKFPWDHKKPFAAFDKKSLRRGLQVYRQVCAACHSLSEISFRHLIGHTHTEEEVKEWATEYIYEDGPNEEGNMFKRPGGIMDRFPQPYGNDVEAANANNGAVPPDLTTVVMAREGEENYIYALLTGYHDPPAGVEVREGLAYNPYFLGGTIAMAQQLYNGVIEYEDGTPATLSQMSKDVTTFLRFTAEIHHDQRKLMALKYAVVAPIVGVLFYLLKRIRWTTIENFVLHQLPLRAPKTTSEKATRKMPHV